MRHLFLMLGYPGSGKSHFARQLAQELHAVRLNGDGIRHLMFNSDEERRDIKNRPLVFGALDYACHEVLRAGHGVVYDVSHNRKKDRAGKVELAAAYGITPILVWVQVPVEVAKLRLETREHLPDQPKLPPGRFERMVANLEPPGPGEKCIRIDGTKPFAEQMASFSRQLKALNV
jgi:predicted kinase